MKKGAMSDVSFREGKERSLFPRYLFLKKHPMGFADPFVCGVSFHCGNFCQGAELGVWQ